MKKLAKNTGAAVETKIDYLKILRTQEPTETYGIKELWRRIKILRKEKAAKQRRINNHK
jgi:hypothetical protein